MNVWSWRDERHRELLVSTRWAESTATSSGRWSCQDEAALGRWRRTMDGPDAFRYSLATGSRLGWEDDRDLVSPRRTSGSDCGDGQSGRPLAVLRGAKPLNQRCHHCGRGTGSHSETFFRPRVVFRMCRRQSLRHLSECCSGGSTCHLVTIWVQTTVESRAH